MPDQGNAQEENQYAYQGTDTGINQAGKEQISTNRAEYEGSGRVKGHSKGTAGDGPGRAISTPSATPWLSRKKPQKNRSRIINHGFKPLPGQGAQTHQRQSNRPP